MENFITPNIPNTARPPVCRLPFKQKEVLADEKECITRASSAISSIQEYLSSSAGCNAFNTEQFLLSRFIYKQGNALKREKVISVMKKMVTCFRKLDFSKLSQEMEQLGACINMPTIQVAKIYLPTPQMVAYSLWMIVRVFLVLRRLNKLSLECFKHSMLMTEIGMLIPQMVVFASSSARTWSLCRGFLMKAASWYSDILAFYHLLRAKTSLEEASPDLPSIELFLADIDSLNRLETRSNHPKKSEATSLCSITKGEAGMHEQTRESVSNELTRKSVSNELTGESVSNELTGESVSNEDIGESVFNEDIGESVFNEDIGESVFNDDSNVSNEDIHNKLASAVKSLYKTEYNLWTNLEQQELRRHHQGQCKDILELLNIYKKEAGLAKVIQAIILLVTSSKARVKCHQKVTSSKEIRSSKQQKKVKKLLRMLLKSKQSIQDFSENLSCGKCVLNGFRMKLHCEDDVVVRTLKNMQGSRKKYGKQVGLNDLLYNVSFRFLEHSMTLV